MATHEGKVITEQDLEDLRNKFHLLEGDRKAYYEMSMQTMKANKALISNLREENKKQRVQLAELQSSRAKSLGVDPNEEEIEEARRSVAKLRRGFDGLKESRKKKEKEYDELKWQNHDLELEAQRPNEGDSPFSRKIRMLENRLDKAMIKYNEAQSIRKTYEQIVKRLKEERVGFDNQLGAIERTLSAKQHDYDELLLLSGDANHAKEVAVQELDRVRSSYLDAKGRRERELGERQELVQAKTDMAQRMENREKLRQDIIAKAAGDLGQEEEEALKKTLAVNKMNQSKIEEESKVHKKKIDKFEGAFRKIKEATGVSDVNEVIQKIVSQEDTQNNLMELTRENQAKIEQLQDEKSALKQKLEEIKYSGTTQGSHRRKVVDDQEEELGNSTAKLDRGKLKYQRLAKILIDVTAGVEHLKDKLDPFRADEKHITTTQDTLADVLYQAERILFGLMERSMIKGEDGEEGSAHVSAAALDESANAISDEAMLAARPYNQRVTLHKEDAEPEYNNFDEGDLDDAVYEGEDVSSRQKIKKVSAQVVDSKTKKSKTRKKLGKKRKGGASSRNRGRLA